MKSAQGYAARNSKSPLTSFQFDRRDPDANDVRLEILFCGVCHSDIHSARDEWGGAIYPMVPGHEIVGRVTHVGASVRKFKVGDLAAVGCMVDACRKCGRCHHGLEQYCEKGSTLTYNSLDRDGKTPTYGGYADAIVVTESFALKVPPALAELGLERVAPLLCAGITTFSPLRHWGVTAGHRVGVVGIGGLGHMGLKIARAFGAHVVALTSSPRKREDALRLGAHEVVVTSDAGQMEKASETLDFILDTVSAPHDLNAYLQLLKLDGKMVLVGLPDKPAPIEAFNLILRRRTLAGSVIGGIAETQAMLDFCAEHRIASDVEVIPIQKINEAYERMIRGDVKYRFVIDLKSLQA